jgi:hypothetical protein
VSGFFLSPRIAWGTGAVEQLSGLGSARAFVLVDAHVARQEGHRRIVEELAKSDTATTVEVASEAPQDLASIALKTVGSLVKGLIPLRSLVAGFLMTTNLANPGTRKVPVFFSSL